MPPAQLDAIIEAWPSLPDETRAAILLLFQADLSAKRG
jgi:hypothetical protein